MRRTRQQAQQSPDYLELKNMVMFFRVSELQSLLGFANANKAGKKVDLQSRALDLLLHRMDEVKAKVREIYREAQLAVRSSSSPDPIATPEITPIHVQPISAPVPMRHQPTAHVLPYNRVPMPMTVGPPMNVSGLPNCPDVRLKPLPFYDILGTLLRPSTLIPSLPHSRLQEIHFSFYLTPSQVSDIAQNREVRSDYTVEHNVQVQLRFCLMETSCEQDDYFPPSIGVKVNNKPAALPNVIPTNKPGVEPKRPPRPVNITAHVKLSPTVTNNIHVNWATEYNRGFVCAIFLVRKLTSADLLSRLRVKGVKSADYTRALIKEKLQEDADSEIATTMLKVSLQCPLGKMRMTTPCRATTCLHLQCFDASLYLQMNEKKPTWHCPVCDKAAIFENLVIDGYFQEVLSSGRLAPEDQEIQLHKDGSWSTHRLKPEDNINVETSAANKAATSDDDCKVEVISDDLEVIAMDPPKTGIKIFSSSSKRHGTKRPAPSSGSNAGGSSSGGGTGTIDLTLSDSDEDDIPLKRLMTGKPGDKAAPEPVIMPSTIIIDEESPTLSPSRPASAENVSSSTDTVKATDENGASVDVDVSNDQTECEKDATATGEGEQEEETDPLAAAAVDYEHLLSSDRIRRDSCDTSGSDEHTIS